MRTEFEGGGMAMRAAYALLALCLLVLLTGAR